MDHQLHASCVLSARVQEVIDKLAIGELTAAYNEAWDDGHVEDWVDTFIPDGSFFLPDRPDRVGADALREMVQAGQSSGVVHITANHQISVEGDEAVQKCYAILGKRSASQAPGSSRWHTTGRYTDTLVRTPRGWRFATRSFVPDAALEN